MTSSLGPNAIRRRLSPTIMLSAVGGLFAFLVVCLPTGCSSDDEHAIETPCPSPATEFSPLQCESRKDAWQREAQMSNAASAGGGSADAGAESVYGDAGPLDDQGLPLGCPPSSTLDYASEEKSCCHPAGPVCPL